MSRREAAPRGGGVISPPFLRVSSFRRGLDLWPLPLYKDPREETLPVLPAEAGPFTERSAMRVRLTHRLYGDSLVCVRYRHDEAAQRRIRTAEIVVDEKPWTPDASKPLKHNRVVSHAIAYGEAGLAAPPLYCKAAGT